MSKYHAWKNGQGQTPVRRTEAVAVPMLFWL